MTGYGAYQAMTKYLEVRVFSAERMIFVFSKDIETSYYRSAERKVGRKLWDRRLGRSETDSFLNLTCSQLQKMDVFEVSDCSCFTAKVCEFELGRAARPSFWIEKNLRWVLKCS